MATMTVSLPDPMKDWIDAQIRQGDYASVSDYVRDLVRRDRDRREQELTLDELRKKLAASRAAASALAPLMKSSPKHGKSPRGAGFCMSEYRLTRGRRRRSFEMFIYGFETFGLTQAEAYREGMIQCFDSSPPIRA